ncbi:MULTISPECIES: PLD nuclease N-terminal domain-containing protein [Corynebacterium]|uniref:PLDc_N domain-containing protein n=1 Tax=Corynebacterium pseudogenitalium TaxID=38303 RepID=A0ABD4TPE4_9CORY|nr:MULTISPECIES: PLD nuclease N-terminal domain-containing protein [unclassified Corynebacterium]MCQ4609171.1 PLDc_N domain-containing protein [Corynebacterium sp. CCUG 61414]MCQ4611266.1 PLDc_N domain-containing protein [Corynebacterium sp. CCUG 51687]MCQ4613216.1 PLDc_N domain-containing protein [Corynebacterium pseudogenitalium]MCQ4615293.1 PLDc_N domain-containing protein [Corynebacterium pseudogenitalium]MDK8243903.1 PLD nuclease N-terminal domain-containing protein [Corynebacterium sp. U
MNTTRFETLLLDVRNSWSGMSAQERRLIASLASIDLLGKITALVHLARTDNRKIRGSKWVWGPAVGGVNMFGWIAYFLFGRK